MSYGYVDPLTADSYLSSIGDTSSSVAPININLPEEKKDEVYNESIIYDNLLPALFGLITVFIVFLTLLSTDLVSTHYGAADPADRAKFAAVIALLTVSLFGFLSALWKYVRAIQKKGKTKPNLNVVWIYGVLSLVILLLLFTTDFFKS
jgi:uncharacterized membrane protein YidH (DUF202 family)